MISTTSILITALLTLVAADPYGFSWPNATDPSTNGLTIPLGQAINIKWNSPFQAVKLGFIAEDGGAFMFFDQNDTGNTLNWAVNVNNSGSNSANYFLYFENAQNSSQNYYSREFKISGIPGISDNSASGSWAPTSTPATAKPSATKLVGISTNAATTMFVTQSITPGTGASAVTAGSAAPTATTVAADSSSSSSSSSTSSDTKVGLGVGIPVAICAIGAVGFAAWYFRRRQQRRQSSSLIISSPLMVEGGGGGAGARAYPVKQPPLPGIAGPGGYYQPPSSEKAILPAPDKAILPAYTGGLHEMHGGVARPHPMADTSGLYEIGG